MPSACRRTLGPRLPKRKRQPARPLGSAEGDPLPWQDRTLNRHVGARNAPRGLITHPRHRFQLHCGPPCLSWTSLGRGQGGPPNQGYSLVGYQILSIQEKFLQIPPQKLHEIVTDIDTLSKLSRMNRRDVQRLAGHINHVAKVCRPARLFMSRILMYLRGHPPGYTKVSEGTKADLRWLNRFLPEYNGVSILQKEQPIRSIEADSCMIGGGEASGDKCYMYKYIPPLLGEMHISQLEAVNCVAAIRAFISSEDRGNTVEVKCDNMAAVSTYTSGRGRDEILLACARAIWHSQSNLISPGAWLFISHVTYNTVYIVYLTDGPK